MPSNVLCCKTAKSVSLNSINEIKKYVLLFKMPKPTERNTKPTGGTLEVFATIRNSLTPNATVTVGKKDTKNGSTTTIAIAVSVSLVALILGLTFFYFICYRKKKR